MDLIGGWGRAHAPLPTQDQWIHPMPPPPFLERKNDEEGGSIFIHWLDSPLPVIEAMERLPWMVDKTERVSRLAISRGCFIWAPARWRWWLLWCRLLGASVFFSIAVGNSDAIAVVINPMFVQFNVMLCDVSLYGACTRHDEGLATKLWTLVFV